MTTRVNKPELCLHCAPFDGLGTAIAAIVIATAVAGIHARHFISRGETHHEKHSTIQAMSAQNSLVLVVAVVISFVILELALVLTARSGLGIQALTLLVVRVCGNVISAF